MPMTSLVDAARTQLDRKHIRYTMVSVVAVATSTLVLIMGKELLNLSPVTSNMVAVSVGCIPSYLLNRSWVWGKSGKSHFWKEVVPFWALALVGLAFSTLLVALAARWSDRTLVTLGANFSAFGVLWIVKYMILDSLLFSLAPVTPVTPMTPATIDD